MSSKKTTRLKLLLDEGLPPKDRFPKLNNLHTVKHIKHDLKKGGSKDPIVYKLAEKEKFLVIVFNTKDFEPLIEKDKPTVISLSTSLTDRQIDLKICKVLKNLKPSQKDGHLFSVTNEGINIKKITEQD